MASADLLVKIAANTDAAVKELTSFKKQAEKIFGGLGTTLGAAIGVSAITLFAKKSIEAFGEVERAANQVRAALEANGKATEDNVKSATDFADALSKVSRFGDDAVLSSQALLASLTGLSGDGLNRATLAAADLAAATGKDLAEATNIIARAANGNTVALKKLNVEFKTGATAAETFANAIGGVEKKFGGRALKDAESFTGQLAILNNLFDDIFEESGKVITELVKSTGALGILSDAISLVIIAIQTGMKPALEAIINTIVTVISVFDPLINVIATSTAGISGFASVISTANKLLQGFIFGIQTIVNVLKFAIESIGRFVAATLLALNALIEGIMSLRSGDFTATKEFFKVAESTVKEIGPEFEKLGQTITVTGVKAADAIASVDKELKNSSKSSQNLKDKIESVRGAGLDTTIRKANEELKLLVDNLKKIADNPISIIFDQKLAKTEGAGIAAGVGGLGSVLKGKQGAVDLTGQLAGLIASSFGPIGAALAGPISEIVKVLAQGPDKVREMVREFARAIPEIITNILESVPVLIEEISNAIPQVVDKLAETLPETLEKLANSLPDLISKSLENNQKINVALIKLFLVLQKVMPQVATSFSIELIRQAPTIAVSFATAFVKEAPNIAKAIIDATASSATGGILGGGGGIGGGGGSSGGGGGGGGGIIGGIRDFFGFASGGVVPGGPPFIDRVPALLTPGEIVIPRSQSQGSSESSQPVYITLKVGEAELSKVLVNLNRRGFRTS